MDNITGNYDGYEIQADNEKMFLCKSEHLFLLSTQFKNERINSEVREII